MLFKRLVKHNTQPAFCLVLFMVFAMPVHMIEAETRFTLSEIENGFILLDQKSGHLSICRKAQAELICEDKPDDDAVLSSPKPNTETITPDQTEIKTVDYYWNKVFSETNRQKLLALTSEAAKRLFEMTDTWKEDLKGPEK